MALGIGKRASQVRSEDALDYVFGYMNFVDRSARGLATLAAFALRRLLVVAVAFDIAYEAVALTKALETLEHLLN